MSRFFKSNAAALASIVVGTFIQFRWELLRSFFYDRLFRTLEEALPTMTRDDIIRLVLSAFFIGLGLWLFWRNSPKRIEARISQGSHAAVATKITELDGRIDTLSNNTKVLADKLVEYGADSKLNSTALAEVRSAQGRMDNNFGFVIKALHARDAGARIKENDGIVCALGPKLLSATAYNNRDHWRSDYRAWEDALSTIDAYIASWMKDGHNPPFLPVRSNELQRCPDMPPDFIREDTVAFKTVSVAYRRYEALRENIASAFATLGALPG